MDRVLETAFPSLPRRKYFAYPKRVGDARVIFRIVYGGQVVIQDGRVLLLLSPSRDAEARFSSVLFSNPPVSMFAKDVADVRPGDVIEFDSNAFSRPDALAFVPNDLTPFKSELYARAVFQQDVNDPDVNSRAGNHYSQPVVVNLDQFNGETVTVDLKADQVITDTMDLSSNEWMECVELKSELLSQFHGRDVFIYAAVVFPKGYKSRPKGATYPTLYFIEGYEGTELYADRARAFLDSEIGETWKDGDWPTPMIRVTLGSRFKFGHTSFADSAVIGPWGTALVSEFIPFLESKFAMVPSSAGRFLHGHSSGGWATLWLQLQFPQFFGGTWSSAPDPVDFSKFLTVDIYEADNMLWDPHGRPYPCVRLNGVPVATIYTCNALERVLARGNGGQLDTFNAVFGPRDEATGMPIPMFDKISGAINKDIVEYWSRYDICKFLNEDQDLLQNELANKIHVTCGADDHFYLNVACESLRPILGAKPISNIATLKNYVDIVPGDHYTLRDRRHYEMVHEEMAMAWHASQH